MANLRQKVVSSTSLRDIQQQINAACSRGWQLIGGPWTIPVEVPGLELTNVLIFMGPLVSNVTPHMATGYTATLQVDIDQWRQQLIYNINAQEGKFLATELQAYNGGPAPAVIRDLFREFGAVGLNTVGELFQVLPIPPEKATSKAAALVKQLHDYAARGNTTVKGVRKRKAANDTMLQGWFKALEAFNVSVRYQLSRYAADRADAMTKDPS